MFERAETRAEAKGAEGANGQELETVFLKFAMCVTRGDYREDGKIAKKDGARAGERETQRHEGTKRGRALCRGGIRAAQR